MAMGGMHNKASNCTPMPNPSRKQMRMSQRVLCASCATFSHFRMAQNVSAVKRDDIEYTSASTALNQKVSLQV